MSQDAPPQGVQGAVPLAAAIGALREELARAWWDGRSRSLRFKPSPVELTLQVAVTSTGTAHGGVKWWLIELGGQLSRESAVTQTVKLTLEPVLVDQAGGPVEFLIDADSAAGSPEQTGGVGLDAAG